MEKEICCRKCSNSWAETLTDFFDDGDKETSGWQRLIASFFGSLLFHISLIVLAIYDTPTWVSGSAFLIVLVFILILSFVFGSLISTGSKGGLIRRFWYGVSLPAVCYFLAINIFSITQEIYMSGYE